MLYLRLALLAALAACARGALDVDATWCVNGTGSALDLTKNQCYLIGSLPSRQALTFCPEFASQSCCDPTMIEPLVKAKILDKLPPIFGSGSCYENLRRMQCAIACWPCNAAHHAGWQKDPNNANLTFYMTQQYARGLYESCSGVCITAAIGGTPANVSAFFKTPADFVASLKTDYDPLYKVDLQNPRVDFAVGVSPEGGSYNAAVLPAAAQDLQGCTGKCSGGTPAAARNLSFCTMYKSSGCCLDFKDKTMGVEIPARMTFFTGTDCCYRNWKRLFCAWMCAPNNADFTEWVTGADGIRNMTMYLSEAAAAAVWNSCLKHPLQMGGCWTFEQYWGSAQDMLNNFDSSNDKEHKPNVMVPRVSFKIRATSQTGGRFDSTEFETACGEDLVGCRIDRSDKAAGTIATLTAGSVLALAAANL